MTPETLMRKARTQLLLTQPFFATLAMRLELVEVPDLPGTMAVDGRALYYNPKAIAAIDRPELRDKLPPGCVVIENFDQLKGALSHEALHASLAHCTRRQQRDPARWNQAVDHPVNWIVTDSGMSLPPGVLMDPAFKGQYAEWVYDRLPQPPPGSGGKPGNGKGSGQQQKQQPSGGGQQQKHQGNGAGQPPPQVPQSPGGFGQVLDSPAQTESERAAEERDWKIAVQEAAAAAKAAGRLPAHLARLAETLAAPKVDWRVILRQFIEELVMTDYTWTRPNRRYMSLGLYLPGALKEGCGEIVIGTDTSGSIGKRELDAFVTEFRAIHEEVKPSALHVVYCDAKVQRVDTFSPSDEITIQPAGGGGTDFRPVFKWVDEQGTQPKCLVYLTDLWGSFPKSAPAYPVLWVRTDQTKTPPFGQVLELEVDR